MNVKKQLPHLLIWILGFQVMALVMGWLTEPNIDPWYLNLPKSPLTPPGLVFGIVWPLLYLLLAIIGWAILSGPYHPWKWPVFSLFSLQMILNWLWTPVFFGLHAVTWGLVILATLVLLNGILCIGSFYYKRWLAYGLLPYMLWLGFALYLNAYIWYFL